MYEIKIEKYNKETICSGCLSADRNVMPVTDHIDLFLCLLGQEAVNKGFFNIILCWECVAILKRIQQFQRRVQHAYFVLQQSLNQKNYSLSSLSTLSTKQNGEYDAIIEYKDLDNTKNNITVTVDNIKHEKLETVSYVEEDNAISEIDAWERDYDEQEEGKINIKYEDRPVKKSRRMYGKNAVIVETGINVENVEQYFTEVDLSKNELDDMLEKMRKKVDYASMPYKCDLCVMGFSKMVYLKKHDRGHHSKRKTAYKSGEADSDPSRCVLTAFLCKLCAHVCRARPQRAAHLRRAHAHTYTCNDCGCVFDTFREFRMHYKELHKRLVCDYCGKSFVKKRSIETHIRRHHSPNYCKGCDRRFASYHALDKHHRTRHPELVYGTDQLELAYCVECDKQFASVYKYKRHLKTGIKHRPPKRISVPCPECGKVFSRKNYMNNHYKLFHAKKSQHHCDICDKYFITGYSLRKHKEYVHEKVLQPRTKMCGVCGRAFTTNRVLDNHMRTHTGERPYRCGRCAAAFAQQTALRTHVRAVHKTAMMDT